MNKKGGVFGSGLLVILLVVYFIFFILIVSAVQLIDNEAAAKSSDDYTFNSNYGLDRLSNGYSCQDPRFRYDAATGEKSEFKNTQENSLKCEESKGVLSQLDCNAITGCSWENTTNCLILGQYWCSSTGAGCIGDINATNYTVEMTDPILGRPYVSIHNNSGLWEEFTPFNDASPCNHPNVIYNKTSCDVFSCSWTEYDVSGDLKTSSIIGLIGDLLTFEYGFGFNSNAFIGIILTIIFFYIPFLLLIIGIYFMTPFAH